MDIKLNILDPFFQEPTNGFHLREIARRTKTAPATVRAWVKYYLKEGIVKKQRSEPYDVYVADMESKRYQNLKIFRNLELLRKSGLIEALERHFEYPTIVLFGSFAKGLDMEKSDIDLCVVSTPKKEFEAKGIGKKLGRDLSLHIFNKESWDLTKRRNPHLINNIANGITLSGQLEVL